MNLKEEQHSSSSVAEVPSVSEAYVYACRMCRRVLFSPGAIMPHNADPGSSGNKAFKRRGGNYGQQHGGVVRETTACTSYFLDPDLSLWVAEESRMVHHESGGADVSPDTIYCPNGSCRSKIGTQSWVGSQCSCGAWVTPAFKIHSRAVDKLPAL